MGYRWVGRHVCAYLHVRLGMRQLSGADEDRPTNQRGFALHVSEHTCGKIAVDGGTGYVNRQGMVRSAGECRGFHLALYLVMCRMYKHLYSGL